MEGVLTMVTEQQQPYGAALRVWRVIHFGSREPLADRIDYTTDHIGRLDTSCAPVLYYVLDELRAILSEHLGGPVSVAATRL